jgi:hypothetical protein
MVNALEPRAIGARFDPLAFSLLMVPSGGETDVKRGFRFGFSLSIELSFSPSLSF